MVTDLRVFKELIDSLPLKKRIENSITMSIQAYGSDSRRLSLDKFSEELAEFIMIDTKERIERLYPEIDTEKL